MFPIAEIDATLSALLAAILSGGIFTAYRVARTAGRETESIAARTLIEVNEELRKEIDRKDRVINSLEKRLDHMTHELEDMRRELAAVNSQSSPFLKP